jgi:DNA polymerase III alpha subunit
MSQQLITRDNIGTFFLSDRLNEVSPSYLDFELRYINEDTVSKINERKQSKIKLENASNSSILYVLGLTDNYDHSKRMTYTVEGEGPDIDTDFCNVTADDLIRSLQDKYGKDRVLRVSTYKPWSLKTSIKAFTKLLKDSNGNYRTISEAERIADLIPESHRGKYVTYEELVKDDSSHVTDILTRHSDILNLAGPVDGQAKEVSIHASAVLISPDAVDHLIPIRKTKAEGADWFNLTQWEGPTLEKFGFIKFDILRIDCLTINNLTCKAIGKPLTWLEEEIPLDDPAVFEMINKGFTAGCFQMEETYLLKLVADLQPQSIQDLAVFSALNRPGPRDSGLLNDYIQYKKTGIPQNKLHPKLDGILAETGGVLLYQEQIMAACRLLAGVSLQEADKIRKAMGKKDATLMATYKDIFVKGCKDNHNIPEHEASRIWGVIAAFAEYGFNKSHALAYAFITYQNAYLKAHYTTDFMLTLMTVRSGKPEKLVRYINEYRQMGYAILPPSINDSAIGFSKKDSNTILFGLGMIDQVGEKASSLIISARRNKRFLSIRDFLTRINRTKINTKIVSILAKVGAFDEFGYERVGLVNMIPALYDHFNKIEMRIKKIEEVKVRNQELLDYPALLETWQAAVKAGTISVSIIDGKKVYSSPRPKKPVALALPEEPVFPDLTAIVKPASYKIPMQIVKWESEFCRFFISRHPLSYVTKMPNGIVINQIEDIDEIHSTTGNLLVAVSSIKEQQIKSGKSKGKMMATLTIEDMSSISEITLFSEQYEDLKEQLDYCSILFFSYKATKFGDYLRIRPTGKITLVR